MPLLFTSHDASRQDADLRAYALTGDAEAFRRMVERHLCTVQQAAMRVLGSGSRWEDDVAQDVFLTLARRARELPADTVLVAWLHRQAVRRAIDVVRSESRRRRREAVADSLATADGGGTQTWNAILPRLDRELLRLPGLDQKILTLRFMERCSSDEAARRLGLTSAAVRKRLERALSKLRERLAGPAPATLTVTALTAYLSVPTAKAASVNQVAAITSHCLSAAPLSTTSLATFSLVTKSKVLITGSILLVGAGAFVAGRHSAPGVVTTGDAGASSHASVHETTGRDRNATARGGRSESAEFPTTQEGRLALLRVILGDGDPMTRNQALDRFLSRLNAKEYQDISSFLAAQRPETPFEFQSIAAAQQALFSTWARQDSAGALAAADASGTGRDAAVQTIANIWGKQDPDAAIVWLRSRPGYPPQDDSEYPFLIGLIGSIATQDLHKVTRLLEEMPSGFTRRTALNGIIPRLLAQGEDAATRWIDGLQDEKLKKGATNRFAENMANIDPGQATNWIIDRLGSDVEHTSIDNVFKQWMKSDSTQAKQRFDSLPSGLLRADALAAIAEAVSENGDTADFRWVYDRMKGMDTDRGSYQAVFDRWTRKDPQEAIRCFEELPQDAAAPISEGIVNRLIRGDDPQVAMGFVKEHFDCINEPALVRALLNMDETAGNAALDDLAASHPESTMISGMKEKLAAIRSKRQ